MKAQTLKNLILLATFTASLKGFAIPNLGAGAAPEMPKSEAQELRHDINAYVGDRRQDLNSNKAPWTAIGRLSTPRNTNCSATLIGPDLVLTAAHCILDKEGQFVQGNYQFQAGYNRGQMFASAGVVHAWWGSRQGHYTDNDWAILQLDARLGDRLGWMGVRHTDSQALYNNREVLYLAAYGSDYNSMQNPYWQRDCNFRNFTPGYDFVMHDCSSSRGSSGGAMFVWDAQRGAHYIVAVNVAERRGNSETSLRGLYYNDDNANIAIPTYKFFPTLKKLLGYQGS